MKKMLVGLMVALVCLTVASPVLAGTGSGNTPAVTDFVDSSDLGLQYGTEIGLGTRDIRATVASIIKTAMGLLGIVAVVIILIGGFTWMTAGGNDEKVADAKKWIFSGIIGLAIILSAYALASFVINQLITATTT